MALLRSHQLTIAVAFLVMILIFSVGTYFNKADPSGFHRLTSWGKPTDAASPSSSPTTAGSSAWKFDPARDSRRYGLDESQCDAAFSDLWQELVSPAKNDGLIGKTSKEDVNIKWAYQGAIRAMIHNNQLYILETKGCARPDFRERSNAILLSINRALTAYPDPLPNIEFTFSVEDIPNDEQSPVGTTWSLTKRTENNHLWLMPDFGYWSWANDMVSSYERVLDKIMEADKPFGEKINKIVWRGAALNDQRKKLLEASKDKEWSDILAITWDLEDPEQQKLMVPIHEHCKYQFAIHTEGRSYSGRLKYLLNCGSVVVIPAPLTWIEYFHPLLVADGPNQNFVQVKTDFSDLDEKMKYYLANPDKARRIAENSVKTFRQRYLTPAAQACYWRKLFKVWRSHSFEPDMYREGEGNKWRGIPFEAYILQDPKDISLS